MIGAAGLDSKAFRLEWPSNTSLFEIDTEEVMKYKEDKLKDMHAVPKCNRVVIAADLQDPSWTLKLQQRGFNPTIPSLWLFEGLLTYLPEAAVKYTPLCFPFSCWTMFSKTGTYSWLLLLFQPLVLFSFHWCSFFCSLCPCFFWSLVQQRVGLQWMQFRSLSREERRLKWMSWRNRKIHYFL